MVKEDERKEKGTRGGWQWVVLVLLCVLAYLPMFQNGFVWDDPQFIVKNQAIRGLWPASRFVQVHGSGLSFPVTGDRPVMVFSLALDYALWKLNPFGYHLMNILLHLCCAFGVSWLAIWLSRSRSAAFLAGALFVLHPGHAEGVIAFAGRSDLLACLFVLLGFFGYVRYLEADKGRKALYYAGSLASFLIACLSKETGLVLLGLLVVYEVLGVSESQIQTSKTNNPNLKDKMIRLAPFAIAGFLYWVQRAKVLGGQTVGSVWWGGSPYKNYLMIFEVYTRYLRLVFFPVTLSPLHTVSVPEGLWDWKVLWGITLVLASFGVTAWSLRRHFRPGFLVFWFLIGLVPVANLIPVPGLQILTEHRLYLASVGPCILGGWGAWVMYKQGRGWVKPVWGGLVVLILVLFGIRTFAWCSPWKTEESIARAIIATAPQSSIGYDNLGIYLEKTGKPEEGEAMIRQAIRLNPNDAEGHTNLGIVCYDHGKMVEAESEFSKAIGLRPDDAEAYNNLGEVLYHQGRFEEATTADRKAIRLNPDLAEAHNNLGNALGTQGNAEEALAEYRDAIHLNPDYAEAHCNLGIALFEEGNTEEAMAEYREAIHLNPDYAEAYFNLGLALGKRGTVEEAIAECHEAIRLKPDYAEALEILSLLLDEQGRRKEAREYWEKAATVERRPEQAERIKYRLSRPD